MIWGRRAEASRGEQRQAARTEVNGGDGGDHDGETYLLLVDDDDGGGAANLESLNSQTLYIDSTSLANGDLSNVVLMTGPPHSAPTVGQVNSYAWFVGQTV